MRRNTPLGMVERVHTHMLDWFSQRGMPIPDDQYRVPVGTLEASYQELAKYIPKEVSYDEDALRRAQGDLYIMHRHVCDGASVSTYHQVLARMPRDGSCGWPYNSEMAPAFQGLATKGTVVDQPWHATTYGKFCDRMEMWRTYGDSYRVPFVYRSQPKEEVRKAGRNPRQFQSGGLDVHIYRAALLQDQCDRLIDANTGRKPGIPLLYTWYNPGNNHYSGNWDRLYRKLYHSAGSDGVVFSYDVTQWDRSVTQHLIDKVVEVEWLYLAPHFRTHQSLQRMQMASQAMMSGVIVMENGAMYRTAVGMKSGDYCTTKHNTFVHILVMMAAVHKIGAVAGISQSEVSDYIHNRMFCQMAGDDGIGALPYAPWIDTEKLRAAFEEFGFVFKQFVAVPRNRVVDNPDAPIEFCSKTFTMRHGRVCGKADMTKQLCKLAYGSTSANAKIMWTRLCAIRRDAWPDPQTFRLIDDYMKEYQQAHSHLLYEDQPDDIDSWSACLAQYETELQLLVLHTGYESATDHCG
jgi:hypothetical protein